MNANPTNVDLSPAEELSSRASELLANLGGVFNASESGSLSPSDQDSLLNSLPRLSEEALPNKNDPGAGCPICYTPWLALLAEEEMATVMDSPAHPLEYCGVTQLSQPGQCGHYFCRRDITKWIQDSHNSCPMCRHPLVQSEGDTNESSEDIDIGQMFFDIVFRQPLADRQSPTQAVERFFDELYQDNNATAEEEQVNTFMAGHLGGQDHHDPALRREDNTTNRDEFAGMYS